MDRLFGLPEVLNGNRPIGMVRQNPDHPRSRGLLARWLFNESGGLTLFDCTGNNHHADLTDATWTMGSEGTEVFFDSGTDVATVGTDPRLEVQEHSLVMLVNPDNLAANRVFAGKSDGIASSGVEWGQRSGEIGLAYNDGGIRGWYETTSSGLTANEYQLITIAWRKADGEVDIWLNDSFSESIATTTGTISYSSDSFTIAAQPDNNNFAGKIAGFWLYNRPIIKDEHLSIYRDKYADITALNSELWFPEAAAVGVTSKLVVLSRHRGR